MKELFVQSFPICVVVALVLVALEEDTLGRFVWRSMRYLVLFYGGILIFSLGFWGLDLLADVLF